MSHKEVERVEGIEPSSKAWEAFVLPLNYTRLKRLTLYQNSEQMRSFYSGNRIIYSNFQSVGPNIGFIQLTTQW